MEVVRDAVLEVRRPTLFGELIIAIVYLPILSLTGIEGKMFRPMAITVMLALIGALTSGGLLGPASVLPIIAWWRIRKRNRRRLDQSPVLVEPLEAQCGRGVRAGAEGETGVQGHDHRIGFVDAFVGRTHEQAVTETHRVEVGEPLAFPCTIGDCDHFEACGSGG